MKEIVKEVIRLLLVNVIINLVFNGLLDIFNLQTNELVSYLICILTSIGIVFIGVNALWKDVDIDDLKKVLIVFSIILVVYNVFYVGKEMKEYEELIDSEIPQSSIEYDNTLTNSERKQLQEIIGTLRSATETLQEYLIQERDTYYAFLFRAYIVIYNLITIIMYCFIAPKWFGLQN